MSQLDTRRASAFARLGITARDIHPSHCPQITLHLREIAKVMRRAGQPTITTQVISPQGSISSPVIQTVAQSAPSGPGSDVARSWPYYLAAVDAPEARSVLDRYQSCTMAERKSLPVEAFCVSAKVSPYRVLELITGIMVRMGAQASTIIAAVNHPRVVQTTVEQALLPEGLGDRRDLHRAVGFLPTAKGSSTTIQVVQNAQANSNAQAATVAPPPESTIRRMVNRFNDAPQIPANTGTIPDTLDAPPGVEAIDLEIENEDEDDE